MTPEDRQGRGRHGQPHLALECLHIDCHASIVAASGVGRKGLVQLQPWSVEPVYHGGASLGASLVDSSVPTRGPAAAGWVTPSSASVYAE